MSDLVHLSLASYCVTFLLAQSRAGERLWRDPVERLFERKWPHLIFEVQYFLECRQCTGFWVSLGICFFSGNLLLFLPVYGASYFLATQERE